MIFTDIVSGAGTILKLKLLRRPTPFIVYWSLTDRCNAQCKYCSRWKMNTTELNTKQIFALIEEMAAMGTKYIIFTGGEPLIRRDIADIVNYTSRKNIYAILISNACLVKEKIKDLKQLKMFVFSLDGPREVQDYLRGANSHSRVIEAIGLAKTYNIKVNLICVLSKTNLNFIDYVLETAEKLNIAVSFQPILEHFLDSEGFSLIPSISNYRNVIFKLIAEKKRGNKLIRNSLTGLRHLLNWPEPKPTKCSGGLLSCRIDTMGYLTYCDRPQKKKALTSVDVGLRKAFSNLSPIICSQCWCGMRVELNNLLQFNLNCINNLIKIEK